MSRLSIEVEGNTLEDAIETALKKLKLPKEKVKVEILAEGEQGLFGMPGGKPAKVRVTALEDQQSP